MLILFFVVWHSHCFIVINSGNKACICLPQLFLDLRYLGSTGNPHPYAREIAGEVYSQIKRYLKACRYYSKEDSFIAHIEEGRKEVKEEKELPKEQVKESN